MRIRRFGPVLYHAWIQLQYDRRGQELVEYALIAASAAAVVSAVFPQALTSHLVDVIRTVRGYLKLAAGSRKTDGGPHVFFE